MLSWMTCCYRMVWEVQELTPKWLRSNFMEGLTNSRHSENRSVFTDGLLGTYPVKIFYNLCKKCVSRLMVQKICSTGAALAVSASLFSTIWATSCTPVSYDRMVLSIVKDMSASFSSYVPGSTTDNSSFMAVYFFLVDSRRRCTPVT